MDATCSNCGNVVSSNEVENLFIADDDNYGGLCPKCGRLTRFSKKEVDKELESVVK